ncbi:MAG: hypothetical protein IJ092_09750 [Atopobiaceae bacterium]|nr:hypothetical protein [Atopobiaceae bacterium]MBR1829826.1 hypothetical protein [Atopobiaceae bacterium]
MPQGFTSDYPFGEFATYNSFASENGLGDTMVRVSGSYDNATTYDLPEVSPGMQMYHALMTDEGGNTWLLQLDWNMYDPIDGYAALECHALCVTGQYQGYSEVYEAPAILVEKVFDRTTGDVLYSTWFAEAV